jgi:hypothetical protein
MQFTLRFLLLTFVLVALCLAVFGYLGLGIGLALAGGATYARARKTKAGVWATIGVVLVPGLGVLGLLPAVRAGRFAAKRGVACTHNLRTLGLAYGNYHQLEFPSAVRDLPSALQDYVDNHGRLPPVQQRDTQGRPLHSWRALLLPYHWQSPDPSPPDVCPQYDFGEAWNGPWNCTLANRTPVLYRNPDNPFDSPPGATGYLAVVGPDGDWLPVRGNSSPVRMLDACQVSIPWLEPRDLTVDEACQAIHAQIPSGSLIYRYFAEEGPDVRALLANNQRLLIPTQTPFKILRAALLGDHATQTTLESYRHAFCMRWSDYVTLSGLVACWITMILAWPQARPAPPATEG